MSKENIPQTAENVPPTVTKAVGELILVATPIGNMQDLSPRALTHLTEADVVACEDTRRTGQMLHNLGITTPMWPIHDHNETQRASQVVDRLKQGETIALVSDAGTPGISDPGFHVVKAVVAAGLPVLAIPGPVAAIQALVVSGLPTDRFCFEGFLPRKSTPRQQRLKELSTEPRTLIFYVAPHRAAKELADLADAFGSQRQAVLAREITKKFEETLRGTLEELAELTADGIKGELVLVVHGAPESQEEAVTDERIIAEVAKLRDEGLSAKQASKQVAAAFGLSSRDVYNLCQ